VGFLLYKGGKLTASQELHLWIDVKEWPSIKSLPFGYLTNSKGQKDATILTGSAAL
jgi:hypothetical protein